MNHFVNVLLPRPVSGRPASRYIKEAKTLVRFKARTRNYGWIPCATPGCTEEVQIGLRWNRWHRDTEVIADTHQPYISSFFWVKDAYCDKCLALNRLRQ